MGWILPASADQPVINRIDPVGFQRGQEVEMKILGARLDDSLKLLFYQPGIEMIDLVADEDGKKATAKLKIADDCQPGLHSMRLASRSGISNLRYFGIGALPIVDEVEPNNDFSSPQLIGMNCTVHGLCTNEDVDYYQVELVEGQTLTVELEGLRLGTDFFDPFVSILDENRFELARSDDATLVQQDCICSVTVPESGKYIIQVRESSFGGNNRSFYRLHVGDFPRPLAIIPSGGTPGETIDATIVDASGQSWTESIQLPEQSGEFAYTSIREGKSAPSPNLMRVADLPNHVQSASQDADQEPLIALETPVALNGVLEKEGEVDWFKIVGKKDQTIELRVYGRKVLRSPIDSWLEIYNSDRGLLAANDDDGGKPDSFLSFKFPSDGEYLIAIRDQLFNGSPFHAYRIEVSPPQPSLNFTVDELQRYVSQVVEVPRGGQMAVVLRANRANFAGPLSLRLENAPNGIELLTPEIAAGQAFIPMMIRVADDAAEDASLTTLIGQLSPEESASPDRIISGLLSQRTMLVRGQNNVDVWGHDTDRMPLAVTEEMPFSISLEQPQVPLTRLGNTDYVVRVVRKEGYAEPISLRVLYNPPGVTASGSISIAGDSSEAKIPVTANHQAAVGTYPITVLAQAKARDGNRWMASEFIQLEIEDSYFDFKFPKAVIAQGESGFVTVAVEVKRPPGGEVELELLGLPAGATTDTPKIVWTEQMESVNFPIVVAADARQGQHKTVVIRSTINRPGGVIQQTQGTGELQIVPPPAKPSEEVAATAPQPATPPEPAAKPLSRLEQLRLAKQADGG